MDTITRRTPDVPKKSCFVIMPFAEDFNPVMEAIREAVQKVRRGIDCVRLDEQQHAARISEDMAAEIAGSAICIADLTGLNANVMWETGYAMAIKRPVVLISQREEKLPFDIYDYRVIRYDLADRKSMVREIAAAIEETLDRVPKDVLSDADPEPKAPQARKKTGRYWIAAAIAAVAVLAALAGLYPSGTGPEASAAPAPATQKARCDLIHVANNKEPVEIADDIYVKLDRIETLEGGAEGENPSSGHAFNKAQLGHDRILERVLLASGLPETDATAIRKMDQQEWDGYLEELSTKAPGKREQLTDYPLARISVFRGKDALIDAKYFLKGELLPEIVRDGAPSIKLRLTNVYNTKPSSGEPESITLRLLSST